LLVLAAIQTLAAVHAWPMCPRSEGVVFIAGGNNNQVQLFNIDQERWCQLRSNATLPFFGEGHATGGDVYVISGTEMGTGKLTDRVILYDRWDDDIIEAPPVNIPRKHARAEGRTAPTRIYLVGGTVEGGIPTDTVEFYDGKDSWQMYPSLRQARSQPAVQAAYDLLWAIGGLDSQNQKLQTTEFLNLTNVQKGWQQGPSLVVPRAGASAVVVWANYRQTLYVCGGQGSDEVRSCEKLELDEDFHPAGNFTSDGIAPMIQPNRQGLTLLGGSSIYAVGGQPGSKVEAYNPDSNQWREIENSAMPQRCDFCQGGFTYICPESMIC